VSVGHVATAIESSGIPTVTIMVRAFQHRAHQLKLPRALIVDHPMGRPLGAAHDPVRQQEVLAAAFDLLESAAESTTIVEFPKKYRPAPLDG
jgi:hypothetical protein